MKKSTILLASMLLTFGLVSAQPYLNNKAPLKAKNYRELPLGSIRAKGWLYEMLLSQKNGSTGALNELYPEVMGERNGWLGGDGDQWERGPYWIDGLLPLAYILDDKELQKKVQPWIEWAIASQDDEGYFGPRKDYPAEKGLQRNNSRDWWPKMVMIKVLQQYYSATADARIITLLDKYFRYQLKTLPTTPLGNWTFWGEFRSGDNLQAVYWLYNITGDDYLLELAELLHKQGFDFTNFFLSTNSLSQINTIHGVNLAQGIKEPLIYYQQNPNPQYFQAVKKALEDIRVFNGQPQGMYGADEALHGNNPTQGSELCSAVELMFSLEKMLEITGDLQFADHIERIAFNALPTQIADDFMSRQYFQQANQVKITRDAHNFDINHIETDLVYGLLTGYPCCTSNMHQGWPKFTQNLWYATNDGGLAAMLYSPSTVTAKVGSGQTVTIVEETNYPFSEMIHFKINLDKKTKAVQFPLHLKIPTWAKNASIRINGQKIEGQINSNQVKIINRTWKTGDVVELILPMKVSTSTWYENAMAVERGPLVYALKIEEEWVKKEVTDDPKRFGKHYFEVLPKTPWNYGIMDFKAEDIDQVFDVKVSASISSNPWNIENAPIEITVTGKQIPTWTLYNNMAGPLPYSRIIYGLSSTNNTPETRITLIPYGCTVLRIAEFPIIKKY